MAAATQDWTQLLNQARVKLPGSSDAALKGELFDVLHEFFDTSSAWTEAITLNVLPNTVEYAVTPDSGQIIRLAGVVDGNNIPQPAIMAELGEVLFANPYNVAQTMTAVAVKSVVLPTSRDQLPEIPSWVLPRWHNVILDGILGKMMGQLNKSYSNETLSTYHLRRFRDGMAQARVAALRHNTFGTQSWRFPSGFATRTQRGAVSSIGSDTNFKFT
jgi:hypothetical protein